MEPTKSLAEGKCKMCAATLAQTNGHGHGLGDPRHDDFALHPNGSVEEFKVEKLDPWRTSEITRDVSTTRKASVTFKEQMVDGSHPFASLWVHEEGEEGYELLVPLDTTFGDTYHLKSTCLNEEITVCGEVKLRVCDIHHSQILLLVHYMNCDSEVGFLTRYFWLSKKVE